MHLEQKRWDESGGWKILHDGLESEADLVFVFGDRTQMELSDRFEEVRAAYPEASIVGGSTGGEIQAARVLDGSVVTAAVEFETTDVRTTVVRHKKEGDSRAAGAEIADALRSPALAHIFLLSDGIHVNGSELVRGLTQNVTDGVTVTGGLAADGNQFERTPLWHDGPRQGPSIVGVGLYGDQISVGHGSLGGWDPFGPQRRIRRSEGNVLYSFDNHSALELYKRYLGPYADDLPASGLRFPLAVEVPGQSHEIVRTVIGIDEDQASITFAGNVPEGAYARFMKVNTEGLIDGAIGAAQDSREQMGESGVDLGVVVSCIGRKQVLQQRTAEEVEHVRKELGEEAQLIGFYSYGEIAAAHNTTRCELHNQTMTITTLSE